MGLGEWQCACLCASWAYTPCLESILRHTCIHRCGLGPALHPLAQGPTFPQCLQLPGPWPSLDTISHEPERHLGLSSWAPVWQCPLHWRPRPFVPVGWGVALAQARALCRGNPTGNGPGQMAALPVLVPGTRMCCLTSGGGPGRLATLRGSVCSQLVPPDPEGIRLG